MLITKQQTVRVSNTLVNTVKHLATEEADISLRGSWRQKKTAKKQLETISHINQNASKVIALLPVLYSQLAALPPSGHKLNSYFRFWTIRQSIHWLTVWLSNPDVYNRETKTKSRPNIWAFLIKRLRPLIILLYTILPWGILLNEVFKLQLQYRSAAWLLVATYDTVCCTWWELGAADVHSKHTTGMMAASCWTVLKQLHWTTAHKYI